MRKVIRSLIIEQIEQEKLLREADLAAIPDLFQTLWNLASVGIITYQIAKKIYNSYKSGQTTKEEVEDLVRGFSVDFLRNGEDEDLSHLEKTMPYNMKEFDDTVNDFIDDERTIAAPGNEDTFEMPELEEFSFNYDDDMTELEDDTRPKYDDTLPLRRR